MMKKISIIALFMFTMTSLVSVHAADDLDDLDALLNDPALLDDTGSTTTDATDTTDDGTSIEENTTEDTGTQVEKLTLTQTGDVAATSVTLQFQPLEEYTHYKIYYAPTGDENFEEKDVTVDDATQPAVVTVDGLNPNTDYQFVVKAFDNDGNPVEATTSDPVTVKTTEQKEEHAAASDNVIYNPTIKVEGSKIIISWKAGADVDKVQISLSEDGKTFKPVATVNSDKSSYTIDAKTTGKKYIKLVPIASDGTLGVCKVGAADVPYLTANVQPKKEAQKKIGHAKTGPETYVLLILAILGALAYTYRKRQA